MTILGGESRPGHAAGTATRTSKSLVTIFSERFKMAQVEKLRFLMEAKKPGDWGAFMKGWESEDNNVVSAFRKHTGNGSSGK